MLVAKSASVTADALPAFRAAAGPLEATRRLRPFSSSFCRLESCEEMKKRP